jgi:hypothetical protein
MYRHITAALVVAATALVLLSTGRAEADQCTSIGGVVAAGVCTVNSPGPAAAISGTLTVDEDVLVKAGATIKVDPAGVVLNVNGNFTMEAGSVVDGSISGAGHGADITINASGDIKLLGGSPGAEIIADQNAGTCNSSSSRGGNITLIAQGNVTTENGSEITTVSPCGKGEIFIKGVVLNLDGLALSQGTTTKGRGGPITAQASCSLTVSPTGQLISQGRDPGADLVHVEGGCDVKILGLVASFGPGHTGLTTPNRCVPPNRPDKPANSRACVEIWAGDSLLIDATGNNNGEIEADTAQSGGIEGRGWIDIFARGPITISGDTAAPFAVHADQFLTNGRGGLITIKSITDAITMTGLAVQGSDTASGGRGSRGDPFTSPIPGIVIEAKLDVSMLGAEVEARGANTGGSPRGGVVSIRSFSGSILANASSLIDVTGRVPADGAVFLTACTNIQFPPGQVTPATVSVTKSTGTCTGSPLLPLEVVSGDGKSYVKLPLCVCGCACTTGFTPGSVSVANQTQDQAVNIKGTGLKGVSAVWFSPDCNINSAGAIQAVIVGKTDSQIKVTAPNIQAPVHVILVTPAGTCCSADLLIP